MKIESTDVKPTTEAVPATDTKKTEKQIDVGKDKGNYIVQIIGNNQILKQVIALNSTVNIIYLGEQSAVADIK